MDTTITANTAAAAHTATSSDSQSGPAASPGLLPQGAPPLPQVIPFAFPGVDSVRCAFTTGLAGNFSINLAFGDTGKEQAKANRLRTLGELGLSRWVELKQVHGDIVARNPQATPLDAASSLEGDGSSTTEKGLALAIKTADCQPILLTNTKGTAVAALHAGWRGNFINFPASGVRNFCEAYNLHPSEVLAVRGPSLGPGAAEFINFEQEWSPEFRPWLNAQRKTMDLWSLTRHQLTEAGVLPEHIFSLDLCTYDLPNLFFSYRRGHQGRQVSLVWLV